VGASLSTASTLLIACVNTFYSDILIKIRQKKIKEQAQSDKDIQLLRLTLILSAVASMGIVVLLFDTLGFTILDMLFAIFSSQLGMSFPVYLALTLDKTQLYALSRYATWAVIAGFVVGWSVAIVGKITGAFDLYSIPAIGSLVTSWCVLGLGLLVKRKMFKERKGIL
jgi:hypothetical protein